MNLEAMRMRGRPRNRWQDKVREDGRLVGGKGWKGRIYNREEWKKFLRIARNRRILHMPRERVTGSIGLNYVMARKKKKGIKTTHQCGAVWGPKAQQSDISITTEGSSLPTRKQV